MNKNRIIMHVDVNSAYLSFTAIDMIRKGIIDKDITKIPSAIGGDIENRTGIILAASIPAKNLGIKTGESIYSAKSKCPELLVYPPDFNVYVKCNKELVDLLSEYTSKVQVFSIDEAFLDMSIFKDNYIEIAEEIKSRIRNELGFAVNIGISNCKLLAKQASDLKPKDSIHTLFPEEIKSKLWTRPVSDLFGVGRATLPKLNRINIFTIGDLANYDLKILKDHLKSHGVKIHQYANGIDDSEVEESSINMKGIGNSTTLKRDINERDYLHKMLLALTESVCIRLREKKNTCSLVQVSLKTKDFFVYNHQKSFKVPTDSTDIIYGFIKETFDEMWNGEYIRQVGVRVSKLNNASVVQTSFFDNFETKSEKKRKLDSVVDDLRKKYGKTIIKRSTFLEGDIKALEGGTTEDYSPKISSLL